MADAHKRIAAGSLNRAAVLLRAIASGPHEGISLRDLVRASGLPRPTVHRVLAQLIDLGWVMRDQHRRSFNLGADLAALGQSAVDRHALTDDVVGELEALANAFCQPLYLDVRSGPDAVCIGCFGRGAGDAVHKGRVGMRVPLGLTPGGLAVLALLDPEERRAIVRSNLPRFRRTRGFDEAGYVGSLHRSVAAGHGVYDAIILDRTLCGLAAAVCDGQGRPIASIGMTFRNEDWSAEQRQACVRALQGSAQRLSHVLPRGRA